MCRLTNCCCCLDLRDGCICISIFLFISTLANNVEFAINSLAGSRGEILAGFIIFTITAIAFWIVLLIGALMRNTTMLGISMIALIAYIVITSLYWLLKIIFLGIFLLNPGSTPGFITSFVVLPLITILALMGLEVYFVLVIHSFRQEIKEGGSGSGLP